MSLQKAVANALSFAHLAGIGRTNPKAAAAAEDDDKKDDTKAAADDKDDGDGDEDDKKKGAKAESSDDKKDDDDKDKEKAKAEAHAAGHAAGVQAERARTAAVLGNPASANNVALAAELLVNSAMSAEAIVSALSASAPRRATGLHDRMAKVTEETPKAKADGGAPAAGGNNLAARLTAFATERARAAGEIK